MPYVIPDDTIDHLNKADEAILRAKEHISEASLLRAKRTSIRVGELTSATAAQATDKNGAST